MAFLPELGIVGYAALLFLRRGYVYAELNQRWLYALTAPHQKSRQQLAAFLAANPYFPIFLVTIFDSSVASSGSIPKSSAIARCSISRLVVLKTGCMKGR